MSDDLLRYRSEFPILGSTTYLISNSLGAMPRGVADALRGYARRGPPAASARGKSAGGCSPPKSATGSAR